MNPAVMRKQMQWCLETYYEKVLKILGASGRPDTSVYKHKFDEVLEDVDAQLEQGEPVVGISGQNLSLVEWLCNSGPPVISYYSHGFKNL